MLVFVDTCKFFRNLILDFASTITEKANSFSVARNETTQK